MERRESKKSAEWLKQKARNRKARPRTIANYEWLLNNYIVPVLGSKPINEVTELEIQDSYNGLLERGISANHPPGRSLSLLS